MVSFLCKAAFVVMLCVNAVVDSATEQRRSTDGDTRLRFVQWRAPDEVHQRQLKKSKSKYGKGYYNVYYYGKSGKKKSKGKGGGKGIWRYPHGNPSYDSTSKHGKGKGKGYSKSKSKSKSKPTRSSSSSASGDGTVPESWAPSSASEDGTVPESWAPPPSPSPVAQPSNPSSNTNGSGTQGQDVPPPSPSPPVALPSMPSSNTDGSGTQGPPPTADNTFSPPTPANIFSPPTPALVGSRCELDNMGTYGVTSDMAKNEFGYYYQVETKNSVTQQVLENELLPAVEDAIADLLLALLFAASCGPDEAILRTERLNSPAAAVAPSDEMAHVQGFSSHPEDRTLPGVECIFPPSNDVNKKCFVIDGGATVFISTGSEADDKGSIERSKAKIKKAMEDRNFDNIDPRIVRVTFLEDSALDPDANQISGNVENTTASGSGGRTLAGWAWAVIAAGCSLVVLLLSAVWVRRRSRSDDATTVTLVGDDVYHPQADDPSSSPSSLIPEIN